MKNKSNYLLKLICLVGIIALTIGFIFGFANLNTVTVEQVSVEERETSGESFTIAGRPNKIFVEKISKNPEDEQETLENIDNLIIEQETVEKEKSDVVLEETKQPVEMAYTEVKLDTENCDYTVDTESSTIEIEEYKGDVDCVIIPEEIDGKK